MSVSSSGHDEIVISATWGVPSYRLRLHILRWNSIIHSIHRIIKMLTMMMLMEYPCAKSSRICHVQHTTFEVACDVWGNSVFSCTIGPQPALAHLFWYINTCLTAGIAELLFILWAMWTVNFGERLSHSLNGAGDCGREWWWGHLNQWRRGESGKSGERQKGGKRRVIWFQSTKHC